MRKTLGIVLFSFLVSLPVILPYFHQGYFPSHDGEWAVVRLADMFRTLRDLQIPARYSGALNFGYGYPLFNFTYPFPYYLGVSIHLLGLSFVNTIKLLFAVSVPLSALMMFILSQAVWKNAWAGFVSAILYIYLPYRLVDLYVRGSLGESISLALFPLLSYLVIKLIGDRSSYFLVSATAVFLAILITTHNIMAVLFLPVLVMLALAQIIIKKKREAIKPLLLSLVLGLGLSAFFWMPALWEKSNILLAKTPIAQRSLYFVSLDQFLIPSWGYGVPTEKGGFSYQLGWPHVLAFGLTVFLLIFAILKRRELFKTESFRLATSLIITSFSLAFLLFSSSAFLWQNVPFLSEINYPWTILAPLGFLVSLLVGFLGATKTKIMRVLVILLVLVAILVFYPYARPQYYFDKGDNFYLTNDATTTSSDELMPLWVSQKISQRTQNKVEIMEGEGEINNLFYNSKKTMFNLTAQNNVRVRVNTIYYPGWGVLVDGEVTEFSFKNEKGVIEVPLEEGNHQVLLEFRETPFRALADVISLASGGLIVIMCLYKFSRRRARLLTKT